MEAQQELAIRKIASLADTGLQPKDIAAKLKLTVHQVKRLQASDEYKALMIEVGDKYLAEAKTKWSQGMARMLDKCLRVIERNLDEGNLEAVKIAIKSLGISEAEKSTGDSTINIVLPTGVGDKVIEVEGTTNEAAIELPNPNN